MVLALAVGLPGVSGCASLQKVFRKDPPVAPEHLTKMRALQAKILDREAVCTKWGLDYRSLDAAINRTSSHKLTKAQIGRVHHALRNYPGTGPEGMELGLFFVSAPDTPGFPKDYRWNWTTEIPTSAQHCRMMLWFSLTKGAIANRRNGSTAIDRLILRQMIDESRRNLHLSRHAVHVAVAKHMLEKKRLTMKAKVRAEFDALEAATVELKNRIRAQDPARDKQLMAQCKSTGETDLRKLDCPAEVEAQIYDLYGGLFQTEFRESAGLSERLANILAQAKIKP